MHQNTKPDGANVGFQKLHNNTTNSSISAVTRASNAFRIEDFKAIEKATLRAVFTLITPSGMAFKQVMLHERDGARWISFQGKPYTAADRSTKYTVLIEFDSKEAKQRFQAAALSALDAYMASIEGHT